MNNSRQQSLQHLSTRSTTISARNKKRTESSLTLQQLVTHGDSEDDEFGDFFTTGIPMGIGLKDGSFMVKQGRSGNGIGQRVPEPPARGIAHQGSRRVRKGMTLKQQFLAEPELARMKYLLKELPFVAKAMEVAQEEKIGVLDEVFESVLWRIHFMVADKLNDPVFRDTIDQFCEITEQRAVFKVSRETMIKDTGICKLSLSLACDCLHRLSKRSKFCGLLFDSITPALFMNYEGKDKSSVYSCVPWAMAARVGDGLDVNTPGLLEKVFNLVPSESRGVFLAKLISAVPQDKKRIQLQRQMEGNPEPDEFHEEDEQSDGDDASVAREEDARLKQHPLVFGFSDDALQLALSILENPPVQLLEVFFKAYDLEDINNRLEHFTVLPRISNILNRPSLTSLPKRRMSRFVRRLDPDDDEDDCNKNNEQQHEEEEEEEQKEQRIVPPKPRGKGLKEIQRIVEKSQLIRNAEENKQLRSRLIKSLILMEDEETALGDALLLMLDQISHVDCSDDFYEAVLESDMPAARTFIGKLKQKIQPDLALFQLSKPNIIKKDANSDSDDDEKEQPPTSEGMIYTSNRRGSTSTASLRSRRGSNYVSGRLVPLDKPLEPEDLPKTWERFLRIPTTMAKGKRNISRAQTATNLNITGIDIDRLTLYFLMGKLCQDRKRAVLGQSKHHDRDFSFDNVTKFSHFVLEYLIEQYGTKSLAREQLQKLFDIMQKADRTNPMACAFFTFAGIPRRRNCATNLQERALYCVLLTLHQVSKHFPFTDSDPGQILSFAVPTLDVQICQQVIKDLNVILPYITLDESNIYFNEATSKEVPVTRLLDYVFKCAMANIRDLELSLKAVFMEGTKEKTVKEFDSEMFHNLINVGLKTISFNISHRACVEEIFCDLMISGFDVDVISFMQAIAYCSEESIECLNYRAALDKF